MPINEVLEYRVRELENKLEHGFNLSMEETRLIISYSEQSYLRQLAFDKFMDKYDNEKWVGYIHE